MKFSDLGLHESILKSIEYEKPTEIQEKAIPLILAGNDVIAQSATGSGKTFAFGAGVVQHIIPGQGIQALILTPTRELAHQVSDEIIKMSRHKRLTIAPVYGGVSINPQIERIRTAEIVVGTPGRILDHLERRTLDLRKIRILVLDEADRMLDMGFIPSIRRILSVCPTDRQTLLFSATLSTDIMELAQRYMRHAVRVDAEDKVDPTLLKQIYYDVLDNQKFSLLVHLLKQDHSGLIMIFCNTKRMAEFVAKNLRKCGIEAVAIHGDLSQAQRSSALHEFYTKGINVLVCTDVASRGLDIKGVTHVYNYDIPNDSKEYTHRIGRTARAGESGMAINILASRDHDNFRAVLRYTDHKIDEEQVPAFERVHIPKENDSGRPFHRRGDFRHGGRREQHHAGRSGQRPSSHRDGSHRDTNAEGRSSGGSSGRPSGRSHRQWSRHRR